MRIPQDTPERWFNVSDDENCVSTAGKKTPAELQDDEFIDCNSRSNARLIAAAPEMLEALEMFVRWEVFGMPDADTCLAHARAAIEKAKGRLSG